MEWRGCEQRERGMERVFRGETAMVAAEWTLRAIGASSVEVVAEEEVGITAAAGAAVDGLAGSVVVVVAKWKSVRLGRYCGLKTTFEIAAI